MTSIIKTKHKQVKPSHFTEISSSSAAAGGPARVPAFGAPQKCLCLFWTWLRRPKRLWNRRAELTGKGWWRLRLVMSGPSGFLVLIIPRPPAGLKPLHTAHNAPRLHDPQHYPPSCRIYASQGLRALHLNIAFGLEREKRGKRVSPANSCWGTQPFVVEFDLGGRYFATVQPQNLTNCMFTAAQEGETCGFQAKGCIELSVS